MTAPLSATLTTALFLWSVLLSTHLFADQTRPKVAIIIDDIGYNRVEGERAARFPLPLTLAVLPFGPNSQSLAKLGHLHGKEIMLHAPMSTLTPQPLDPGALTEDMDQETFLTTLRDNIAAIPYITGLNNHMGSGLTQRRQAMGWLMQELKQQGLFFIDSRTSAASVAQSTADHYQLPSLTRDVFLDHERTTEAVAVQFQRLLKIAHREGSAIAIGHPNKITMDYLSSQIEQLEQEGIDLVSVSELLPDSYQLPQPLIAAPAASAPRLAARKPDYSDSNEPESVINKPNPNNLAEEGVAAPLEMLPEDYLPPEQVIY